MIRILPALALLAAAACAPAATPPSSPAAAESPAAAAGGVLTLRNPTDRPLFFAVFEQGLSERVRFAPCTGGADCPSIAPGGERRVAYAHIPGYHAGATQAVVYTWHASRVGDPPQPEGMESRTVPLPR